MTKSNTEQEYIPFGKEWEKEMMRMTKPELIDFLRSTLISNRELNNHLLPEVE
jgi:hypothetical protein